MYAITTSALSFLFLSALGLAVPAPAARPWSGEPYHLYRRQGTPTLVPQAEVDSFGSSTHFAAIAYCGLGLIKDWACGKQCDATPGFETSLVGGDGGGTPNFYVGFDPTSKSVVVAHQGTNLSRIESLLVDADFAPDPLNPEIFPGLPSDLKVHGGFQDAHARSASQILQAVQNELATRNTENVLLVGHSLGAALALLDGVLLGPNLPSSTQMKVITYGMPRVGNKQFADFVDANVKLTRITNGRDFVPILPGRFLGFCHSSGEMHFPRDEDGAMFACPGQENTDGRCSVGDAKNMFLANIDYHNGPYNGMRMDC